MAAKDLIIFSVLTHGDVSGHRAISYISGPNKIKIIAYQITPTNMITLDLPDSETAFTFVNGKQMKELKVGESFVYNLWPGDVFKIVTGMVSVYPKAISRGLLSFTANNIDEEIQFKDFMGIEPVGVDMDTYLSKLDAAGLTAWKDYWTKIFTDLKRTDVVTFVATKAQEYIGKLPVPVPPAPTLKVLPKPDIRLHDEGITLYYKLDDALFRKDVAATLAVLRRMLEVEQSPFSVFGIMISITAVVTAIMAALGSIGFAKFMFEETLQTIDMSVYTTSQAKQYDLAEKALAKKKEILDITPTEAITELLPGVNLIAAVNKYTEAAKVKYDLDVELIKRKQGTTTPNANVSIENAAAAIAAGTDPSKYLPASVQRPELTFEELETKIVGIIDGDTYVVSWPWNLTTKVRILGIDAPEFNTAEGKTAMKFATDLLYGKIVTLYIDPKDKWDAYNRILAKIMVEGKDAALEMLKSGNAIFYPRKDNKYVDAAAYQAAQVSVAVSKEFKINIVSEPTNAKLYIDNVDAHHRTPSNEVELKKELKLLTVGKHVLKATKAGMTAEKEVNITDGDNGTITLTLAVAGLPAPVKTKEQIQAEIDKLLKQIEDLKKLMV